VQQGECAKRTHRYGRFLVAEGRGEKAFSGSKISVGQIRKIYNKKDNEIKSKLSMTTQKVTCLRRF
jgi:hypothetical protein